MNIKKLVRKLEGIHDIQSVMNLLSVNRQTAINYVSKLRKEGYVKTKKISDLRRIYNISTQNKLGGKSYYEIINSVSPIKISEAEIYKIHGREPTFEETLIYALKTKKLRVILAALALFKHINNWTLLGYLARKNKVERKVGALYDLARTLIKIRRMSMKFRKSILPKSDDIYCYIIGGLKSKDFIGIQQKWRVYLPFNLSDLEVYLK